VYHFLNLKSWGQAKARPYLELRLLPPNLTYRNFKVMDVHHSIFELHLLRIAKFALGVRQLIAAFNHGIYSVPSKCREINFTEQGGNQSTLRSYGRHSKLPHSTERCHARKSKSIPIYSPFEVGRSMLNVRSSDYSKVTAFSRLIQQLRNCLTFIPKNYSTSNSHPCLSGTSPYWIRVSSS
jgi:hypothetical protein